MSIDYAGWLRKAARYTSALMVLTVLQSGTAAAQDRSKEIVVVTSGGSFEQALKKHFYNAFTAETGITVRTVTATYSEQWAKARAMTKAGQVDWDIVTVGIGEDASNRDLLADLDCAAMPNVKKHAIPGACGDQTLLRTIGGTVLVYDTRAFKDRKPSSWADFWNTRDFPGPRSIPNYGAAYVPLALALLADGAPLADVRNKPLDVNRAFAKLDKIKPDVQLWWKSGDQSQHSFRNRDVVMSMMWSGRALQLKQAGVPVELVWDGASAELSSWAILKNAPNKAGAVAFLNFFVTRPEAHLLFSGEVFWDTVNREALQKTYGSVDVFTQRLEKMVLYDAAWIASERAGLTTRWNEWITR